MLRIGARGSQLSTAQVEIVRKQLNELLGIDSEFIPIKSHGDINTAVPIMKVQQEGAFTSTLESALLSNEVDIAVHSFKDLPTTNPPELKIVAILKRHSPSDTLVIHKDKIKLLNNNEFELQKGTRIGTGSARRQTQLLHYFPNISTIDIRGNVETRLKKLEKGQYDGILLASAVFERIDLNIPEDCVKIDLDTQKFPTAPAQGAICIQMKQDHPLYSKIAELDHSETRLAVELERNILQKIGGGCQLPLGVTIFKGRDKSWFVNVTLAPDDWRDYANVPLTKIHLKEVTIEDIESQIIYILPKTHKVSDTSSLTNKEILLLGNTSTTSKYENILNINGAITVSVDVQEIITNFSDKLYKDNSEAWLQADWVLITSKNAVQSVRLFEKYFKKNNLKLASVGFSTTKLLQKYGFAVHYQPVESNAKSLADGLKNIITKEEKLLFLSANNAKSTLKDIFESEGYSLRQLEVYTSVQKTNLPEIGTGHAFDIVVCFSPTYARLAIEKYGSDIGLFWLSIGPSTTKMLQDLGIKNYKEVRHVSVKDLLEIVN